MFTLATKKAENDFTFYQNDGLVDIYIGLGILFAGIFLWAEKFWMAGIFIPVLLPSFQVIRKQVLEPRIGFSFPTSTQQANNHKVNQHLKLLLGILVVFGISILFVFIFLSLSEIDWFRRNYLLVIGMIFSSTWIIAGVMLNIWRYYLYGVLSFVAMVAAQFANLPFWIALAILGGMIAFIGVLILIRFLQQNPIKK